MRMVGLLSLLVGCVIIGLQTINLLCVGLHVANGQLIGGALLCVGVAALVVSWIRRTR